ncbi:hypothetical protein [Reinekea sp. G2M2-21]|uniref:hypothetical protein n=1 Tax=Reinekea sp. G2M2-21 TaxID=2788942 RepID=UPI0018AC169D|nr:hypothetical protein [Reinekea sp. G2M2-21]
MKHPTIISLTLSALLVPAFALSFQSHPLERYLFFGGDGYLQFLGCLDCKQSNRTSIYNNLEEYGSDFSQNSLMNPDSMYSKLGSVYSACEPSASYPPLLVDQDGVKYGFLTVNESFEDRLEGGAFQLLIHQVCFNETHQDN